MVLCQFCEKMNSLLKMCESVHSPACDTMKLLYFSILTFYPRSEECQDVSHDTLTKSLQSNKEIDEVRS